MTADLRRMAAKKKLRRYRADFEFFAKENLKIRDKKRKVISFEPNPAQEYVLKKMREQQARLGYIRAIVLKGRQQGISTLISGLYYHEASLNKNVVVYILAHEQAASDSLFSMVDRYHKNNPIKPSVGTSNAKELKFDKIGSEYIVATAGAKAGGRSRTATLFHGSEVAFWPNAPDHFAASVQTIPLEPGTAIILESTANGASGEFYERWMDAEAGLSDYIPIFVPWFWQPEYRRPVPEGWVISDEKDDSGISEREYAEMHGCDLEQMAWRRAKIAEFRSASKFRQEYPATPAEAFISSSEDSFIEPHLVLRARKRKNIEGHGPLIIGADPSGPGGDRFAIAARRGAATDWVKIRNKVNEVTAANWIRSIIDDHDPERVNIDAGGMGHAIISMVRSFGKKYDDVVYAVNFGGKSQHKMGKPKIPGPKNRRAEMWKRLRDWLSLEEGVSLPDMDALQSDLNGVRVKPTLTNDLLLESKEEMKKRGVRSPDLGDALALTFASIEHIEVKQKPKDPDPEFPSGVAQKEQSNDEDDYFDSSHNGWMG